MGKEINIMWYIHEPEYSSVLNWEEIPSHATAWMDLDEIVQSEISQSWEDKCRMTPFI